MRFMRIGEGFAADAANSCSVSAASCWNVHLPTVTKPVGMRRVHLRGRENILKRLLVHVAGFNLSLVMRLLIGKGTPRGLQDLATLYLFVVIVVKKLLESALRAQYRTEAPVPQLQARLLH